ncbi:MAG: hypothetical protein LBF22_06660 [Deltaproteobacteria bacterium]|nr:hypothetical protein [Deltaproteobacteria bacterium]
MLQLKNSSRFFWFLIAGSVILLPLNSLAQVSGDYDGALILPPAPPSLNGESDTPPLDFGSGQTNPQMIERVSLQDFTLSAIVVSNDPEKSFAMVENGGMSYIVHKGMRIGNKNGVIREITASSIIVEEPGSGSPGSAGNFVEIFLPQ